MSEAEKQNARMASIGWRMKSLDSAADSLLKSASRLEEEVKKETRYWNQALAVKEKGWSLSRLPREKHTLGVRYGFAEGETRTVIWYSVSVLLIHIHIAYSDFRDRGLAALRRQEDGSLSLDRGFRSMGDRTIRVRLLHEGKPIASSMTVTPKPAMDTSVEVEILNARNSIFDEELHHEIHREARNLVNQGVRCVGTRILIPFELNKQLEIDLVSTEDNSPDNTAEHNIGSGRIVQNAILVLRILLSDAHRQNLRSRSKKPPALRESKPPRQLYPILKPIVEYLQHRSHVRTLRDFLAKVRATIEKAGLSIVIGMTESTYDIASISNTATKSGDSKAEALVKHLTAPLNSTITIDIIDDSTVVNFDVQTTLAIPEATTFNVVNKEVPPLSPISQLPQSTQYTTLADVENTITQLTTLSLLYHIISKFGDWRTFSPHGTSIMRTRPGTRDREIVSLMLGKGQLSMTWQRSGSLNDQGLWTWEAEEVEGTGETRSLIDVFQQLQ